MDATNPNSKDPLHLSSESISQKQQQSQKFSSGSLLPELVHSSSSNIAGDLERGDLNQKQQHERNYSGPLLYRQIRDFTAASGQEESLEGRLVQRKGRFKVTSADVNSKVALNSISNQVGVAANYPVNAASLLPTLHFLLQQNALQREQLVKLIKCVEQSSSRQPETPTVDAGPSEALQPIQAPSTTGRERELQTLLAQLQQSVGSLAEDVQKLKVKNSQLERQIGSFVSKGGKEKP